jgi:putative ABC transport system permease protein
MLRESFKFMWYDKAKLFGILFGIVISVFLIGQQLSILFALLGGVSTLVDNNAGYIWVTSDKTQQVAELPNLDVRIGRSLYSVPGVKAASPLIVTGAALKFSDGSKATVSLVGAEAPAFRGGPWNVYEGQKTDLLAEGAIAVDLFDQKLLNNVQRGERFEINGRRAYLAVWTKGIRGFGNAYTFTTLERARLLGNISTDKASAFLVEWNGGESERDSVIANINAAIPGVRAWSAEDFARSSVNVVLQTSGIATSFGLLVAFAIIAGLAIVGLTLYSAVNDRIRDYGTIKAIGGSNALIRRLILGQAVLYAISGFILAYGLLEGFRLGTANTGLIIQYPPLLLVFLVVVTLFIATLGSLFAIRKITKLEPVQIFRM